MSKTAKIVVAVLAAVVVLYVGLVVGIVLVAGEGGGLSAGAVLGCCTWKALSPPRLQPTPW